MSAAQERRKAEEGFDPNAPLLEVEGLRIEFRSRGRVVKAVNSVSFGLAEGETLAILGESGSGKSATVTGMLGLLPQPPAFIAGGSARFRGVDLLRLRPADLRKLRGREIAIVFQDALSALNPVVPVGTQIAEMYRVHLGLARKPAHERAVRMLERVGIPDAGRRAHAYPHEFSGGMRQRAMIATALALEPSVVIADEPTTALDVTIQAQILDLLGEIQRELAMGLILITHDLGVVADIADQVIVMYAGRVVETASALDLYARPLHPYTRGLLESIPRRHASRSGLAAIPGAPPNLAHIPSGCAFHPRCPRAREICALEVPALVATNQPARRSACHFWKELLDG